MLSGEAFTTSQMDDISDAVRDAHEQTGLLFSVYVGEPDGNARDTARRLHAALGAQAEAAVLMFVAPGARRLEIVTGEVAARRIDDRACGLAALSATAAFAGGELAGGIVTGIRMLAEAAGPGTADERAELGRIIPSVPASSGPPAISAHH